jgi:hypothetical protein
MITTERALISDAKQHHDADCTHVCLCTADSLALLLVRCSKAMLSTKDVHTLRSACQYSATVAIESAVLAICTLFIIHASTVLH